MSMKMRYWFNVGERLSMNGDEKLEVPNRPFSCSWINSLWDLIFAKVRCSSFGVSVLKQKLIPKILEKCCLFVRVSHAIIWNSLDSFTIFPQLRVCVDLMVCKYVRWHFWCQTMYVSRYHAQYHIIWYHGP